MKPRAISPFGWISAAALLAFDLWLVTLPPLDVPYLRELYFAGVASGREPLTWDFLTRPTLEHVMPLPMAVGALAVRATGLAGASRLLNVLLLALSAYALSRAAATLRGRPSPVDAAIPLMLLGPAHVFSFVSGFNLQLVLSGQLFSVAVAAAAVCAARFSKHWLAAGLAALLGLPLCGVSGVLSAAFAAPALAWVVWRHPGRRALRALPIVACAGLALFCFPFGRLAETHERVVDPLRLASELLPAALGAAGTRTFPLSAALVVTAVALALVLLARAGARPVLVAIALGVAGQATLALAIGFGRSHYGNALAFTERYVELAVPWLVFAHLGLAGAEGERWAFRVQAGLGLAVAASVSANAGHAIGRVHEAEAGLRAFSGDARAGLPLGALVERHGEFLYPFDRGFLRASLSTLMVEPLSPFDASPFGGMLSLEAKTGPCASDRVSWAKPSASWSAFAHAPERALDGHGASEWRAPETRPALFELALREPQSLSRVCILLGAQRNAGSVLRLEAFSEGRMVAHAVASPVGDALVVPLSAPRADRVKLHLAARMSLAELALAP